MFASVLVMLVVLVVLLLLGLAWLYYTPTTVTTAQASFVLQPFPHPVLQTLPSSLGLKATTSLPTVLVPGMGDSCFNPGFSQLVGFVSQRTNTSAICIGPGFDPISDAIGSFAKTMGEQVEQFKTRVRKHPELKLGFNAIGLSQGNLVIRAYVQRYNDPPVVNFISIHGPHAGVSSLPRCDPNGVGGIMCTVIDSIVGGVVYSPAVQAGLAQANYFRDQMHLGDYLEHCSFLPEFLDHAMANTARLTSLRKLVLIMAQRDTMIIPKESEWFGALQTNSRSIVVPAEHQPWYQTLGLNVLQSSGRLITATTAGNHLDFSKRELDEWIDLHLLQ
ncbi:hypothetical protein BASA81_003288 [Batrachochytrium salamandrivorans]|nr:hypothetical protein BASA81_003288 [Batrachochytrium salamandrivorans]